jgi:hypothetical protein
LVADGLKFAQEVINTIPTNNMKLTAIDAAINAKKAELAMVRSDIQRTKFAIIVSNKWFDELTSHEDNVLDVDGNNFTILIREVKVEI